MSSHPALRLHDKPSVLLAMIQSTVVTSPTSSALCLITDSGVEHAWLTAGKLLTPIAVGQVWEFHGNTVTLGEFGDQFVIASGIPALPRGKLLLDFLRRRVPGLGMVNLCRWEAAFGQDLPHILARGEFLELARSCRGRGPATLSRLAISAWNDQVLYTRVARELYAYGFDEATLRSFIAHYGARSFEMLEDDPYRLLAFTGFDKVDRLARDHYAIGETDLRRLMGAVDASIYECHDQRRIIVNRRQLLASTQRLAKLTRSQADHALQSSERCHRIISINKTCLVSEGNARLTAMVVNRLLSTTPPAVPASAVQEFFPRPYTSQYGLEGPTPNVVGAQTAIVIAQSYEATLNFLRTFIATLRASQGFYEVIGGTDALTRRIHADGVAEAISIACLEDVESLGHAQTPQTLIVVSTTINFSSMAGLLQHINEYNHIVFVGEPQEFPCERQLPLFQALMSIDSIPKYSYHEDGFQNNRYTDFTTDLHELLTGTRCEVCYDARLPDRPGLFFVSVGATDIARAAAGLCHQLSTLGTVSIVLHPDLDRGEYVRQISESTEISALCGSRNVVIEHADRIEPGDSDSSIVILVGALSDNSSWIKTAIRTARSRAVVIRSPQIGLPCGDAKREVKFTPIELLSAVLRDDLDWNRRVQ